MDVLNATAITGFRAPYLPGWGINHDFGRCDFDINKVVHVSGIYELPVGRGKRFLHDSSGAVNAILGGWVTNWILTLQDGQPGTIPCATGTTSGFGCFAIKVAGQDPYAGPHNVNQWLNPAAFETPPVATTIGQTDFSPLGGGPAQFVGPGFHRLDFSLFKLFQLTERFRLEFRSEFFQPDEPSELHESWIRRQRRNRGTRIVGLHEQQLRHDYVDARRSKRPARNTICSQIVFLTDSSRSKLVPGREADSSTGSARSPGTARHV